MHDGHRRRRPGRLTRILGLVIACLSLPLLLEPKQAPLPWLLWVPRLFAGAWSGVLLVVSAVGAIVGLAYRDGIGAALAAGAALVFGRYLGRIKAADREAAQELGAVSPAAEDTPPLHGRRKSSKRRVTENVAYARNPETGELLLADVWEPAEESRSGLTVVYVYGGGWHYLHRGMGTSSLCRHLTKQGHVVMLIDYTLPPSADLFGMIADVQRAIAWLGNNAERFGVSADRIALMGTSSGAHMALLTAYACARPAQERDPFFRPSDLASEARVCGVVGCSGMADLADSHAYFGETFPRMLVGRSTAEKAVNTSLSWIFRSAGILPPGGTLIDPVGWFASILGGTPEEVPRRYELGSPIHHVGPHCPPTLLLQGASDFTGVVPRLRDLHQALIDAGCESHYVGFPGTDHGFDMLPVHAQSWGPAASAARRQLDRFLVRLAQRKVTGFPKGNGPGMADS